MGRHDVADDWEDDPEEPDESDMDDDAGDEFAETVECPNCGRDVYDQAEQCPKCGAYLSREDSRHKRPVWLVWTALVLLAMIIYFWTKRGSWF
jgi:predicted nucleic acid-binding Zn ribbon protein